MASDGATWVRYITRSRYVPNGHDTTDMCMTPARHRAHQKALKASGRFVRVTVAGS